MSSESAEIDHVDPSPLEERLVAYLDGELDDAEVREIAELLAADAKARAVLASLDHPWTMLDKVSSASVDEVFTRTTVEMVSVKAAEELARDEAEIPRRQRRRRLVGTGVLAMSALAGFLAVAVFWPSPNRQLLQDLPVLEDLDELQHVFNKEDNDLQFLQLLHQHKLFVKDAADDS
jgi:anti-sigma factor RsiW